MQLPDPARINQGTQLRCWAAGIEAILEATGSQCRSLEFIIDYVRTKTNAVIDGNGALKAIPPGFSEWSQVLGLFGMRHRHLYSKQVAAEIYGAETLTPAMVRTCIQQNKYALLMYKDPTWIYNGGSAWHALLAYGVNDADDLQVMDPAGGVLATVGVIAEFDYLLTEREINKPWSPG